MTDDLVVLWRESEASRDICCEIVQIAEGEFELRILCDGRLFLSEEGPDVDLLVGRARELCASFCKRDGMVLRVTAVAIHAQHRAAVKIHGLSGDPGVPIPRVSWRGRGGDQPGESLHGVILR